MRKSKNKAAEVLGKNSALLFLLGISIFFADQAVKRKINREKPETFPRPVKGTRGFIELRKAENPGFSMGKGGNYPGLVRLGSVLAMLFLFFSLPYLSYTAGGTYFLQNYGAAIIMGGAMSNTFDRLCRGKVTDYLYIRFSLLKKIIINIGDIAIFFGAFLYFAGIIPAFLKAKKYE